MLRRRQGKGQPIRDDGPEAHAAKSGTPTMGGLLVLSALVFSTVMWARLDNNYIIIVLFVTICFGGIGFIDDYLKVSRQNPKGVSSKIRLLSGFLVAAVAAYFIATTHPDALQNRLALPIFKNLLVDLGFLLFLF